jgi:hypothetical protein
MLRFLGLIVLMQFLLKITFAIVALPVRALRLTVRAFAPKSEQERPRR